MNITGFTQLSPGAARCARLVPLFLCASVLAGRPAGALISAAGDYQLETSVRDNGGGTALTGGGYASRGAVGQSLGGEGAGGSAAGAYVNRAGFYDPPHFTFQKGLASVVNYGPGSATLVLPAGAVDKEVFDITLNYDSAAHPLSVDPGLIDSANAKMERNGGSWSRPVSGQLAELLLFDEQSAWDRPFAKSGTITMGYRDDNGDGVIDGTDPPVRTDTIKTWTLDEALGMWAKLPSFSSDKNSKTVTVPLMSPGVYALLGTLDESVKDTYAFPIPFRPNGPNAGAGAGQTGTEAEGITFANIPQAGNIEIYTLDGRLVRKLSIPAGLIIPKLRWDVRTAGGDRAASGVYLWRVVSGSNDKTGKLMVIW